MSEVRRGCLILADISGYTRYLTGVELEHSHDVLADLLGVVAGELGAVGALAKLEGDAVFVCDHDASTTGEQLLAGLDASYAAFMRRRRTISLRTTCTCEACARIPSLDLKFAAHHGEFVEHVVAGRDEVLGADVILVHRLLKNEVAASLGTEAFALLTSACVAALELDPLALALVEHSEAYEDVGAVACWVADVGARWRAAQERNPVVVADTDALVTATCVCPAPRGVVWDALLDPASQLRWRDGATAVATDPDPSGSRGVGSRTHCVHGPQTFDQEILDWRPFDYYTYAEEGPFGPFLWTFALADEPPGDERRPGTGQSALATRVTIRVKLAGGRRQRMLMLVGQRRLRGVLERNLASLAREAELRAAPLAEAGCTS